MLREMAQTWLEVALNGSWSRAKQPRIPVSVREIVAEGIACAGEGAAIVHAHAYDEASGRQRDDADLYARIIEGIRGRADCIVYPTIPFGHAGMPAAERFAAIEALASRFGFHPGYAIYEAGFLRLGAALARAAKHLPQPIYRFMFSQSLAFGFPPEDYALEAYLRLLAGEAPGAPWMVAGLGVDIEPLVAAAVRRGGHVRVGLEDAPLGSARSNLDWVRAGRGAIERAGGHVASAAEVRAALR